MSLLRSLPRNVWVLSLTSFLRDVASEMLVHLVPLFMANVLGTRTVVIGLVEGLAETTASLVKLWSGWLSDRWGKRKSLTVAGYGLATVAMPLLLVTSWVAVLAYRLLDRFGKGVRTAPRDALIADSVPADRRGLSFGLHRAADSAGAFLGLLLAMALVWHFQAGASELGGGTFRAIVLWSLVPATLAVLVVALGARDVPGTGAAAPPRLSLRGLGTPFLRFLVVVVLFTLGNSSDAFLVLRVQDAGGSVLTLLGMLAAFNLVYTVLSGPAGHLSDRLGRRGLVLGGWALYALVYLGFAAAGETWHFWVLYPLYGVYYALTEGVLKAMVADQVPEADRRGTAYGVYHAAVGLAALPASLVGGALWQGVGNWGGFGPSAPFLFGGSMALLSALLLWLWVPAPRADEGLA